MNRFRVFLFRHRRAFHMLGMVFALLTVCMCLTACAVPTWLTDAEALMPVLMSSATSILSFVASATGNPELAAALAIAQPIIDDVGKGLTDLQTMIEEYKGSPSDTVMQNIEAGASDISANLNKLLGDIGLPAALATKLQAWAQLVLSQLNAWLEILPQIKTGVQSRTLEHMARPATDKVMRADDLKNAFNAILDTPTGDPHVDEALAKAPRL